MRKFLTFITTAAALCFAANSLAATTATPSVTSSTVTLGSPATVTYTITNTSGNVFLQNIPTLSQSGSGAATIGTPQTNCFIFSPKQNQPSPSCTVSWPVSAQTAGSVTLTPTITLALNQRLSSTPSPATITVNALPLTATLSPQSASAAIGSGKANFNVQSVTSSQGTLNSSDYSVTWSVSPNTSGTFSITGSGDSATVAVGPKASGSATITAEITPSSSLYSKTSGTATLNTSAATLKTITVTPSSAQVSAGNTQQFTATGTYSDNSQKDLTNTATWTSNNGYASVSNGLVKGVSAGTATITASEDNVSSPSATLTITAPALENFTISPASVSALAIGNTQTFTATGHYSNGDELLNSGVTWTSSNPNVAAFSSKTSGLLVPKSAGTTTVSANYNGKAAANTVSITTQMGKVTAVIISAKGSTTLSNGKTVQLTADAKYASGSVVALTDSSGVTWSSTNTNAATVDQTTGLVTPVGAGTSTITASYNGVASNSISVTAEAPRVVSISISPAYVDLAVGKTQTFNANVYYAGQKTPVVNPANIEWQSSSANVTINPATGIATAASAGTANITATFEGVKSNIAPVTVTTPTLQNIVITPPVSIMKTGDQLYLNAEGFYGNADQSQQGTHLNATWSSTNSSVLSVVTNTGKITAVKPGAATITAEVDGIKSSVTIQVTAAALKNIQISSSSTFGVVGQSIQFTAVGTYTDGLTGVISPDTLNWISNTPDAASFNTKTPGLLTLNDLGETVVQATQNNVESNSIPVTIALPSLTNLNITSSTNLTGGVAKGSALTFTAKATYGDNEQGPVVPEDLAWNISPSNNATITSGCTKGSQTCTITVNGAFNVNVSSASYGAKASNTLEVTLATLQSLSITPSTFAGGALIGSTQTFTASANFSNGSHTLPSDLTWVFTPSTGAATITSGCETGDATCTITMNNNFTVDVTSPSNSDITSNVVNVSKATLALSLTPSSFNGGVLAGSSQTFTANADFSNGANSIPSDLTWTFNPSSGAAAVTSGCTEGSQTCVVTVNTAFNVSVSSETYNDAASKPVDVNLATLTALNLTPSSFSAPLPQGSTQNFTINAVYTNGSGPVPTDLTWNSSNTTVASFPSNNCLGQETCTLTINADSDTTNISASSKTNNMSTKSVTVTAAPAPVIQSNLAITPNNAGLAIGPAYPLNVQIKMSNNALIPLPTGAQISWTSSAPQGLLTFNSNQLSVDAQFVKQNLSSIGVPYTITATCTSGCTSALTGTANVIVTPLEITPTITYLPINQDVASIANGGTMMSAALEFHNLSKTDTIHFSPPQITSSAISPMGNSCGTDNHGNSTLSPSTKCDALFNTLSPVTTLPNQAATIASINISNDSAFASYASSAIIPASPFTIYPFSPTFIPNSTSTRITNSNVPNGINAALVSGCTATPQMLIVMNMSGSSIDVKGMTMSATGFETSGTPALPKLDASNCASMAGQLGQGQSCGVTMAPNASSKGGTYGYVSINVPGQTQASIPVAVVNPAASELPTVNGPFNATTYRNTYVWDVNNSCNLVKVYSNKIGPLSSNPLWDTSKNAVITTEATDPNNGQLNTLIVQQTLNETNNASGLCFTSNYDNEQWYLPAKNEGTAAILAYRNIEKPNDNNAWYYTWSSTEDSSNASNAYYCGATDNNTSDCWSQSKTIFLPDSQNVDQHALTLCTRSVTYVPPSSQSQQRGW